MTPETKIAIIGAGNMGSSLISGLVQTGHPKGNIIVTDPNTNKLEKLKLAFQIETTRDNKAAIAKANVVLFAVKPQLFAEVVKEIKSNIQEKNPLIISIAAGIRLKSMEQWLGDNLAMVRAMPNTPALINAGVTALFANNNVTVKEHNIAESLLRSVGTTVWLPSENLMDVVTALSGSGPAYFFLIMQALQQAAEHAGLERETARLLTLQTALGAAKMAIESGESLETLRLQVTSPGGTTEKAIAVLEKNNIRDIFSAALEAAKVRSEELAELMGNS